MSLYMPIPGKGCGMAVRYKLASTWLSVTAIPVREMVCRSSKSSATFCPAKLMAPAEEDAVKLLLASHRPCVNVRAEPVLSSFSRE